ncbi:MAG: 2-amino-4-hydroxy-6-hydroxymethyldihydropteridine diphosphokinase [Granulosicoccus sp.]
MTLASIALGSNLGDRHAHLTKAVNDIDELMGCTVVSMSSVYETEPMGPAEQPDYLNAVCQIECDVEPHALLYMLKDIERQHGRVQVAERWTARPLDLDILLFGQQSVQSSDLQIPHPGIAHRSFVLWPLAELDADMIIPGAGSVTRLQKSCESFGIRIYQPTADH